MKETTILLSFEPGAEFGMGEKVRCIKAVRAISRFGLKEAKMLIDRAQMGEQVEFVCLADDHEMREHLRMLKDCGGHVDENSGRYEVYVGQLREIITVATLAGDYYVARKILELLDGNL